MTELVNEVIKNCEIYTKMAPQSIRAPLHPLVSNSPMEICMLNFFGSVSPDLITGATFYSYYFCICNIFQTDMA